jgi:glycosyltransferase involved in cell wall biosynthesis
MHRPLSISIILPQGPDSWPSLSIIRPQLLNVLNENFINTRFVNILENKYFLDDVWVFPPGTVQAPVLTWLSNNFKHPLERPRSVFFLGGEGAKICYHLWHYRNLFRPDDHWVVSCEAEKRLIDHWFPNNNRTSVLFYPVDMKFRPAKDKNEVRTLRKKLILSPTKNIMLYAGRISPQKNILSLLDLLEAQKDLSLLVCGDVDSIGVPHIDKSQRSNIANDLLKEIGSRNLSTRIEFRPHQSQSELLKIMKACDYQVSLSSHYGEDFGYSIAQGLACGLKTILSSWGGHNNWKSLTDRQSVSYLKLNWEKDAQIGIPEIPSKLILPEKSPDDFTKSHNTEIANKLKALITSGPCNESSLEVRPELVSFWEQKKSYLFETSDHTLFKKVVGAYQGHEI